MIYQAWRANKATKTQSVYLPDFHYWDILHIFYQEAMQKVLAKP